MFVGIRSYLEGRSCADFEFLNILSLSIKQLKSDNVRGEVFKATIQFIFAALAALTPSGAFSTIIISIKGIKFLLHRMAVECFFFLKSPLSFYLLSIVRVDGL